MATDADQFAHIESLTQRLLVAAEAEEWEQAFAIEAERRPLIEQFFSHLPENRRAVFDARVKALLEKDKQVMTLGQSHQRQVGEALKQLNKGKSAVKAYQEQR